LKPQQTPPVDDEPDIDRIRTGTSTQRRFDHRSLCAANPKRINNARTAEEGIGITRDKPRESARTLVRGEDQDAAVGPGDVSRSPSQVSFSSPKEAVVQELGSDVRVVGLIGQVLRVDGRVLASEFGEILR
jgi:hypothetical protein